MLVLGTFGLSIFAGAFLLFLVQPLIAKFILPWFGGSPAVWTTCMLFFQVFLLGGYAYAHFSTSRLKPRQQVVLHLTLLALALLLLPITPGNRWKPLDGSAPTLHILLLLSVCLGLPYLVVSATGPLMQAWFSQAQPGVSPYRLYALSNVGSLLALLSFPFVVEPNLSRQAQAGLWSAGLAGFALLCAGCGCLVWKRASKTLLRGSTAETPIEASTPAPPSTFNSRISTVFLWFALPACGVVLLLAVTNRICQDIAVVPFLWVLPLGLYLLSFIISFDSPRWYARPLWFPLLALTVGALIWVLLGHDKPGIAGLIGLHLAALFVCCMVCHGEVYRLKPSADRLTGFYLSISAGGAAGGLFVALAAPLCFRHYHELQVGFALVGWLLAGVLLLDRSKWSVRAWPVFGWALVLLTLGGAGTASALLYRTAQNDGKDADGNDAKDMTRNFYGVLKVLEYYRDDPENHQFILMHGAIIHGMQYVAEAKRRQPTSYFTASGGVGRLMKYFQRPGGRRVGVIGLGTGSMAAWGQQGDTFRFYEINEEVVRLARERFTYLQDTPAHVETALGDGRLLLESEPSQQFDILVMDAFSGDAPPVHLLTREAFEIYRRHLKPDGVIAVNISNNYLNFAPVVTRAAEHFKLCLTIVSDPGDEDFDSNGDSITVYGSDWALLSANQTFLNRPEISQGALGPQAVSKKIKLWTDEQSSLWRIMMVSTNSLLGRLQRL